MSNEQNSSIIIGAGEIGKALFSVLSAVFPDRTFLRDIEEPSENEFPKSAQFLHICIPFKTARQFKAAVYKYLRKYHPEVLVIHSTVPIGTTREFGPSAVHSPVRGVHPDLVSGIITFVKYIGAVETFGDHAQSAAHKTAILFELAGLQTKIFQKSETTEAGKILETTQYGWFICLQKEIKRVCDMYGLDFNEVYTEHNTTYNAGYDALEKPQFHRPILKDMPGPIGGHCVVPNTKLLKSSVTDLVKKFANLYEKS